jgi:UDP-glucose 4-epimerase
VKRSAAEPYAGRRVVVTGGLGFIGSTLVHRLVEGGADVTVIDALLPDYGGNPANIAGIEDRLRVARVDLREAQAIPPLVEGAEFVFNLASQISHADSMRLPLEDLSVNVTAQLNLLETLRRVSPMATIVYASTRQFYGKADYLPVDERHPIRPPDVNGIHKYAAECHHLLYHAVHGLKATALRLTNVFGPRMRIRDARQTFVGIWLRRVLEGQPFEVWEGAQRRDLAYVDDVAEAFLLAGSTPALLGRAYNVGGSPPITLEALAELLVERAGGGSFERKSFPAERKSIDIGDFYADDSRFRAATGWAPNVGVAEGLDRALAYYRPRLAAYL